MSPDLNSCSTLHTTSDDSLNEKFLVGFIKSILIGTCVGLVGVALSFILLLPVLIVLREQGLFLLLVLIPIGAIAIHAVISKYYALRKSRLRGAVAFGIQYLVIGAGLGLFFKMLAMGGEISCTYQVVFCGSLVGTMIGSIGGAFQGWIQSRIKPVPLQGENDSTNV